MLSYLRTHHQQKARKQKLGGHKRVLTNKAREGEGGGGGDADIK